MRQRKREREREREMEREGATESEKEREGKGVNGALKLCFKEDDNLRRFEHLSKKLLGKKKPRISQRPRRIRKEELCGNLHN